MIRQFLLPQLSMGMSEGTIIEWLSSEGISVKKDSPLLNLETEKVAVEIPAPYSGYLHIEVKVGDTVPIETVIASIADTEEEYRQLVAQVSDSTSGKSVLQLATPPASGTQTSAILLSFVQRRTIASGLARKTAEKLGINLGDIAGTGPNGRIIRRDVLKCAENNDAALRSAAPEVVRNSNSVASENKVTKIPLAGMRKTIAERMMAAKHSAASTYVFFDIDVSKLLNIQRTYLAREATLGTRISLITLYAKALATALESVPICNATLEDDVISMWEEVNVGIAVALPDKNNYGSGLIVPVVKQVGRKNLLTLDREIKDLVKRAREREVTSDELQNATVTLSSTAGFFPNGWSVSAPILNLPQVISFQPGSVTKKPLVVENEIAVRDVLPCGLTFDHRAMDGEPAGRLARRLEELLANPELLLL